MPPSPLLSADESKAYTRELHTVNVGELKPDLNLQFYCVFLFCTAEEVPWRHWSTRACWPFQSSSEVCLLSNSHDGRTHQERLWCSNVGKPDHLRGEDDHIYNFRQQVRPLLPVHQFCLLIGREDDICLRCMDPYCSNTPIPGLDSEARLASSLDALSLRGGEWCWHCGAVQCLQKQSTRLVMF